VILGAFLAVTAAGRLTLATSLLWRGIAAIVEAYLIYWAVVYYIARKWFGFNREWAAPLASGISICGVSAAIAVGGAIRARPIVPVMVSSLVVIFAVVEVLILPFLAQSFLWQEPMVAGAWMGLAVKTDGAAIAGGGITESLILAKSAAEGIRYQPGWILGVTATVKVFIDIFIGIWAFVLGYIWTRHINPTQDGARVAEIWQRFPKFIIGFVLTFVVGLALALATPTEISSRLPAAIGEANTFRVIFFILTFFSIGVLSDFRRLWQEGVGKLAAVYVLSLFGFVIWVGLAISWLFFAGVRPPLASWALRRICNARVRPPTGTAERTARTAIADRKEVDRLESWYRTGPAGHPPARQPLYAGVSVRGRGRAHRRPGIALSISPIKSAEDGSRLRRNL
jgi:uncharacterized membrane protein YadS